MTSKSYLLFPISYFLVVVIASFVSYIIFLPKADAATLLQKIRGNNLGLSRYWSFNGADITNGVAINLGSGSSSNGFFVNIATSSLYTAGKMGQGVTFDGVDDYMVTTSNFVSTSVTYSLWLKTGPANITSTPLANSIRTLHFYSGSGNGHKIAFVVNGSYFAGAIASTAVDDNQWHHVVGTGTGSDIRIYVDGVLSGTAATALNTTNAVVYVGSYSSSEYFPGSIDDVRIYTRVLSAAEVKSLYLQGQGVYTNTSPSTKYNSGLVGYWTLDGADTVWTSATAATTLDKSGNGNTGTLTNMARVSGTAHGKIGQALNFDGVNDRVAISAGVSTFNQGASSYSVSGWIYESAVTTCPNPDSCTFLSSIGNSGNGNQGDFFVGVMPSGAITYANWRSSGDNTNRYSVNSSTGTLIQNNTWYHVVTTFDGTNSNIYINGTVQPQASVAQTGSGYTLGTYIGTNYTGDTAHHWNGRIDEVRVYNRALSTAEIKALYQAGATKFNTSPSTKYNDGLVGYWSFNGADTVWTSATAATTLDKSGNGNTGTLTSMVRATSPVEGKIGQGLNFDDTNDSVSIGSVSAMDISGAMTISAWIKPNAVGSVSNGDSIIVNGNNLNSALQWSLFLNRNVNGLITFSQNNNSTSFAVTNNTALTANVWTHVVAVRTGSSGSWTITFYINGVADGAPTGTADPGASSSTSIGRNPSSGSNFFNGTIDEVRVYNRALSATEARQLYLQGK